LKWAAIVVAAGRGTRLGGPKQFIELAGLPMVGWSLRTFAAMREVSEIVVATEPESIEPLRAFCAQFSPALVARIVPGGATRQQSVCNGLREVSGACEAVLVHDGARPLVRADDVRAGMREVRAGRASLLAAPVVDTLKVVDPDSLVVRGTPDRRTLWAAQTPQFAHTTDLRAAHEDALQNGFETTDDAALLERAGVEVIVVPSTGENFKVTAPGDLERARAILTLRLAALAQDCAPSALAGKDLLGAEGVSS
jgi:2-C-methyl-D-erythritol 4-phosphate cytidylyltransferase